MTFPKLKKKGTGSVNLLLKSTKTNLLSSIYDKSTICKIARVTPICKTGDKTLPANYRPISILNTKILGKTMKNRLSFLSDQL